MLDKDLMTQIEEYGQKKKEEEAQKVAIRIRFLAECVKNTLKKEKATVRETKQTLEGMSIELQNAFNKIINPLAISTNDKQLEELL